MKSFAELRMAINNNIPIVWCGFIVSYIDYIDDSDNWVTDLPILIQYNEGRSEAEVFLHELNIKI
jgi:hypothetical protein